MVDEVTEQKHRRFEYRVSMLSLANSVGPLRDAGEHGWELVSVVGTKVDDTEGSYFGMFYFKRERIIEGA